MTTQKYSEFTDELNTIVNTAKREHTDKYSDLSESTPGILRSFFDLPECNKSTDGSIDTGYMVVIKRDVMTRNDYYNSRRSKLSCRKFLFITSVRR